MINLYCCGIWGCGREINGFFFRVVMITAFEDQLCFVSKKKMMLYLYVKPDLFHFYIRCHVTSITDRLA